jgi:hypothetical protein
VSQATNGDMMTPAAFITKRTFLSSSALSTTTAPPTVALWPSKYFVVLWTEMFAPSSSGRW